jgi:hypothetical protein
MKRKWMETAVVWLLVVGPLLIGLGAAIWWGSGNNTVGLWGGFVPGTIALVFAAAFQTQAVISKSDTHEVVSINSDNRDRPWISLEVGMAGPLTFANVGRVVGSTWNIPLRIDLKNTGNTPAFGVDTTVKLIPFMFGIMGAEGRPTLPTDVAAELKKMSDGFAGLAVAFPQAGRTLSRDQPASGVTQIVWRP